MVKLAVNGTLMRGLELNHNLLSVGATFVREAKTAPVYRLWSIGDRYPAMQQIERGGGAIALEVWEIPPAALSTILEQEPPGLCIGKVSLADGETVLGVLGEAYLCEEQREITPWGGWRAWANRSQTSARIDSGSGAVFRSERTSHGEPCDGSPVSSETSELCPGCFEQAQ